MCFCGGNLRETEVRRSCAGREAFVASSAVRGRPSGKDVKALAAIEDELDTVRVGVDAVEQVFEHMRELVSTETLLMGCPVPRLDGWDCEHYHATNFDNPTKLRQLWFGFFAQAPRRFAWYDAVRPEPWQRNVVLDVRNVIPRGELEASDIYHQLLVPARLHQHHQVRVLICEGPWLLAWFGTFQVDEVDKRHHAMLARLVPVLRRRLAVDRRLQGATRSTAALDLALEHLGAPAFVLGPTGTIHQANTAGRALLDTQRIEIRRALAECLSRKSGDINFELVALRDQGAPAGYLAVLRATSPDERIRASVAKAAARWGLSRRQAEVLDHVVRGHASATIAAILGISVRAVEVHVTALLARADVENRAALVAKVLLT